MVKCYLWNAAKYVLGIGMLAFVIWHNWGTLANALSHPLNYLPLSVAFVAFTTGVVFNFLRWFVLVRAQSLPFTVGDSLRLGTVGLFMSTFLPGSIGGDFVKAVFLAREQSRRTVAVATVLVDRAMGLWGLIWVVALGGGLFWLLGNPAIGGQAVLQWIILGASSIVAVSLSIWLLLGILSDARAEQLTERLERIPKVGGSAAEMWRALWMYRQQGRSVALALLIALTSHCCFAVAFFCAAITFQQPQPIPSLGEHFVFFPIGETIQVFFPAPGGMGGAEYAYGKLYDLVGFREDVGVLAALGYRAVTLSVAILSFVFYLSLRPASRPSTAEPANLALVEV